MKNLRVLFFVFCLILSAKNLHAQKLVSPKLFGAVGDGKADDTESLRKAIEAASSRNGILVFDRTYLVSQSLELKDIKIRSNGVFNFIGTGKMDPLFWVRDNVEILGKITVSMAKIDSGLGTRAPLVIGDYESGEGSENVSIDTVIVSGGHNNMNGMLITGSSNKVVIKYIRARNSLCGRVLTVHWGNSKEHYPVKGQYVHVPSAQPTTHPKNIEIGSVIGDLSSPSTDFMAIVAISASSNIKIGSVSGSVNNKTGLSSIVLITAGDLGYAYSGQLSPTMSGISIGTINGRTDQVGLLLVGRALYAEKDKGKKDFDSYNARINCDISSIDVSSAKGNSHAGVSGSNGNGSCNIARMNLSSFYDGVVLSNFTRNVNIGDATFSNIARNPIRLTGVGNVVDQYPDKIKFDSVAINSASNTNQSFVLFQKCNDVSIRSLNGSGFSAFSDFVTVGPGVQRSNIKNVYMRKGKRPMSGRQNGIVDNLILKN